MSVSNAGSFFLGLVGAVLTQVFGVTNDRFDNLAALIILSNLNSLFPLLLLGLLPCDDSNTKTKDDMKLK